MIKIKNDMAWTALMAMFRAYYTHNVFHHYTNSFGKGTPSDYVMTLVRAVDGGVDLMSYFDEIHSQCDGVCLVNEGPTELLIEKLGGLVNEFE
ncbi:hypothetical protein [Vibrio barjaei]|uniref:hypothetical protein n=1 Tax=Vibrio barjaei TaxID=1676683 RepID=UPI002283EB2C|nr:hypothetical protein [Vibrio barjaei]MCY9874537.1 hypothetical protein [Vibrio barjaei]